MPRPRHGEPTALGAAVKALRADATLASAADQIGIPLGTLSRVERGTHVPSMPTALRLSRWLGWTIEQVIEAAELPAEAEASPEPALRASAGRTPDAQELERIYEVVIDLEVAVDAVEDGHADAMPEATQHAALLAAITEGFLLDHRDHLRGKIDGLMARLDKAKRRTGRAPAR